MFCFQCQETAKNTGCTVKVMCGKPEETANLQDLLIFVLRGIACFLVLLNYFLITSTCTAVTALH